jgi:hypothetical protein
VYPDKLSYILSRYYLKRSTFILSTVAGIGAVSASAYYFFGGVDYDPELAKPQSLSLIWDAETINKIGSQYRTKFPSEDSERSLVKLLHETPTEASIASDFENGDIVIVDGWILSATEARQCALASAQQSR